MHCDACFQKLFPLIVKKRWDAKNYLMTFGLHYHYNYHWTRFANSVGRSFPMDRNPIYRSSLKFVEEKEKKSFWGLSVTGVAVDPGENLMECPLCAKLSRSHSAICNVQCAMCAMCIAQCVHCAMCAICIVHHNLYATLSHHARTVCAGQQCCTVFKICSSFNSSRVKVQWRMTNLIDSELDKEEQCSFIII